MKVTDLRRKLIAALVAGGTLAPSAVYAANLDENLVVNADFESVDLNTSVVINANPPTPPPRVASKINNWDAGTKIGYAYSHTGVLDSQGRVLFDYANGGPLASGGNYYFSSNATPTDVTGPGQVMQVVDVSTGPTATLIATGTAAYKVGAFFSSYLTNNDFGNVHLDFRNSSNVSLGTAVAPGDLDVTTWTQDFRGGLIPVGTTSVRVSVFGTAFSGGPDGYIDNVDFRVINEVIQPRLEIIVNRATGAITLSNRTNSAINIKSYSITSAFEALEPANWLSIAENYDAGSPGPNQVDAAHHWTELTDAAANGDLSEADLQSAAGGLLVHTRTVNLANSGAWIQNPTEDLVFQYISGTEIKKGIVSFIGNGGVPFASGDLNVDGVINPADWAIFRTNQHANLSTKSLAEAYRAGDLNADKLNNFADFVQFKTIYDAANGAGAFAAMSGVPEPSNVLLVLAAGLVSLPLRRRTDVDKHEP
jgi:hypothetical protein